MSTQTATFLFTDLVDSTSTSVSMSPEAAESLRQGHFSLLRAALEATGGVEVKNLGDGLMVVYTSAVRALAGAVGMQQALDRHNRRSEVPLAVRIGVSMGEATEENGDYFGDPVVEAARLCAAAGGGRILTTAMVKAVVGRNAVHTFEPVGQLELKGLPGPLEAWEVTWEEAAEAAVPLPARWRDSPQAGFVGRVPEREVMDTAWKEVAAGGRQTVLLSGEPGIGKTRLARETALAAFGDGAVVLFGGCDEGLGAPYRPWMEALGHLVTHLPASVLASLGGRQLADLGRVVPALRDRDPDLASPDATDPETERYLFYAAVVSLLSAVGTSVGPVVLTIDDLQWADRQSLALLRHVVSAPELRSVLVVSTFRDADIGSDHPLADLLAALRRDHGVIRLALSGLDDGELVALLDASAREPLGEAGVELARALYRETDGNPFFAWEVMRHLSETGWAVQDDQGHWTARDMAELSLPDSVREVVGRRVSRLGTDEAELLGTASVLGSEFDLGPLAGMTSRLPLEVLGLVEKAETAGLVRSLSPGRFRFGHAIIHHTLYESLSPTRRALLHRQAAEALEAAGPAVGTTAELARHWAAAVTPADAGRAVSYSRKAGEEALDALAPDQAAEHFRRALELHASAGLQDGALRAELLCCLAEALCQAGDPEYEQRAMEAARLAQGLGEVELLVRAALIHYRLASSAYDAQRYEIIESALETVGPGDSASRALLLAELAQQLTFVDGPRARAVGDEAQGIGRRLGDGRLLLKALCNRYGPIWDVENLDLAREGIRLAQEYDDPVGLALAAQHLFHDCAVWGDRGGAEQGLRLFDQAVARVGRPDLRWIVAYCHADWACMEGDLQRSETLSEEAWRLAQRTGQPGALLVRAAQTMMINWHRGRPGDAAPLVAQAAAADPDFALLHLDTGSQSTPGDLARAIDQLPLDGAWLAAVAILAEQAARSGDRGLVQSIYERLSPHRHLFNKQGPLVRGPVAHTLALLAVAAGRHDEAAADFAAADALNERLGVPFYRARTQIEWARFLTRHGGNVPDPRVLLQAALTTARRHGFAGLERRADRLLHESAAS